ncbi:aldose 1-epimerase family protein [Fodinibius salsisoli]|uniref:Aldose 1-epimerase family protein n=1 Tax=Fodinibius salsisoli TaxID=2820877 RepID=A0ABT3PHD3_9BACT|nr:aldose 1-epimerase family protein [Fodinibius salsisoli]MCW9705326.1 aldose 1-epimerase family protein [Fodinibius salsisoli]
MSDPQKPRFASTGWRQKVSNHQQVGGIETAILDNGQGKGTRVAWINTGSGLRFKVVLDRAMDIAGAFYGAHSLAWISHSGVTPPNPAAVEGATWLDSFGGGLLTTCGLTHVGGPEEDEHGVRGLHDTISHTPATIESILQPDLKAEQPEMSITGRMVQSTVFGPHLELKRTISARLGESSIYIHDEVTNLGNEPAPHMILYHCNFGWPLVDEGAKLLWEGDWEAPNEQSRQIFNQFNDFKKCSPPLDTHSGSAEAVAFIDAKTDEEGICRCGIQNTNLGLRLSMEFEKEQLPWLTNWQHWGKKEYVTALEPCTHPPIGQSKAREEGTLIELNVGETRTYDITLTVED